MAAIAATSSTRKLWSLVLAGTMVTLSGCGNGGSNTASDFVDSSSAKNTIDPTTAGSITGTVRLLGTPPVLKAIDMNAAPACIKANTSPVNPPQVVTGDNGSLADVAIYIKSGLGNRQFESPKVPVVLKQKACMYEPHVIALMVNQKMEVVNDDSTSHNVHVLAKTNKSWNQSQSVEGPPIDESFAQPELAVPIACNVHPWMRAYAFVFSNPYYAVTSKTGMFEIKNLPPGTYVVEAWQERYGTKDQTVAIGPKESKTISFTFTSRD